jgi:Lrp/AsnC family transcriptional regulator for asnA, asnC and gidA
LSDAVATPAPGRAAGASANPFGLDATDRLILQRLAVDARMSVRGLARDVGMSAPGVADRLARLERTGVVRGYRADIDYAALDLSMVVFVAITCTQSRSPRQLLGMLRKFAVVEQADIVTGPMDLIVRVRVRDHAHMRDVLFDQILQLDGVSRTETYVSLEGMEGKNLASDLLGILAAPDPDLVS